MSGSDRQSPLPPPPVALGVITVLLTLLGWSSIPLFLRHFAELIDPWTSNGWRYGFSALLWAPVLIVVWFRGRSGLPRGLWKAALIPSFFNAAGQVIFTWAHYKIDPGLLTFGLRSQLIFVAVGAWILFPRERAIISAPAYLVGLALLLTGTATVMLQNHGLADRAHLEGVLLAIGSGMLFAAYGLSVRKYMEGVNSVLAFAAICQYTALAMVVLMLLFGEQHGWSVVTKLDAKQIALLLGSAVIGIAIGHVFYYISIARLGVAVTAGVLQLQPFVVSLASLPLFGERLSGLQWLAGCGAVAGALLMLAVQQRLSRALRVSQAPLKIAEGESGS